LHHLNACDVLCLLRATDHILVGVLLDWQLSRQLCLTYSDAQCKEVRGIKGIALRLFEELKDQTESVDEYVKLSEILASNNSDAMQRRFNKVADFSGRVDNMKKLTETVKTIIDLERKVNKIDTDTTQGGVEDFLKKFRNV